MKEKVEKRIQGRWTLSDLIIIGLQLGGSVVFLYFIKSLVPIKYWAITAGILGLLFLTVVCTVATIIRKIKKVEGKKRAVGLNRGKIFTKVVSLLLSIILIVGCAVTGKGLGVLDDITNENYQTRLLNILVLQESPYKSVGDIDGKVLGLATRIDKENTEKLLEQLQVEEKISVEVKQFDTVTVMAEALYNGTVDAILLSEGYRGLIEDTYGTFSADTRILYEFELKEELKREETNLKVTQTPFNIYISGIDTYGKVSTVSRSDVNMIVTINPTTKQILMTSIPRDYYVELASFGAMDKLTHAGIYGVEESMSTLEEEFGIDLHYYARVNFTSLIKIVNALGGISVYNDYSFTSYHTHDYYPKGDIYMDGETTLEFVRERYNLPNGDYDRVKNQQKVLTAMLKKAMSPVIIKNYNKLLNAASDSVITSLDADDIQSLIQMQLDDMASWDIEQISISGTGTTSSHCYSMPGQSVYVMKPDYDSVNKAVEKIYFLLNAE